MFLLRCDFVANIALIPLMQGAKEGDVGMLLNHLMHGYVGILLTISSGARVHEA